MSSLDKIAGALKEVLNNKRGRVFVIMFAVGVALLLLSFALPSAEEKSAGDESLDEYKVRLEEELADMCSDVEGAGKCRVMVSFSAGERREYKSGVLISSVPPEVQGVTVLCKGGDSVRVKAAISELISALYGIGSNRICVLKLS